jgi:hypothetical protein
MLAGWFHHVGRVVSPDGRTAQDPAKLVGIEEQVDAGDLAVALLAGEDERHGAANFDDERSLPVDHRFSNAGHLAPACEVDGEASHPVCAGHGVTGGPVAGPAVTYKHDVGVEQFQGSFEVAGADGL